MKKDVLVKNVKIGEGAPVSVQSMTNTSTADVKATLAQIARLKDAGAEIVRVSVPDRAAAEALKTIVRETDVPIVADIHYDADLAIKSLEAGAHKLRLNPSNMPADRLKDVARALIERNVPVRVGVNEGSVKREVSAAELAALAVDSAKRLEDLGVENIVLAVKSSDVKKTVEAYRALDKLTDHPLHIGLTEAGTVRTGSVKSAIAVGSLLLDGIGDTMRISLAGDPVKEVEWGIRILRAAGVRKDFVEVIACPTCSRTTIDVHAYAERLEELTEKCRASLKVAVMGCAVNGIGESRGAEIGVCGGRERSLLFKDGVPFREVPNESVLAELEALIREKTGE